MKKKRSFVSDNSKNSKYFCSTKINNAILEKCTEKTLEQLKNIFNACFSARYFSTCSKEATIKFLPKKTKLLLDQIFKRSIQVIRDGIREWYQYLLIQPANNCTVRVKVLKKVLQIITDNPINA